MWQKEKKDSSTIGLSLLLALILTPVTTLFVSNFVRAQSSEALSSPLPETLSDLKVRIDGSDGMLAINQKLKQGFEKRVSGTEVEVAASGMEAALQALEAGNIDIAAIGRGLTPDEKAQGLELVRLRRDKIAVVVGKNNPFKGSLTIKQFARIIRGRMTNWSRLGRTSGKIRFIDRPESSEIRQALSGYSIFRSRGFTRSSNTIEIAEEDTSELVKQLGIDGISYIKADWVSQLPGVRVVPIHGTLPTDSKYPFSLPLVYVYKKNPSSPASRFLAFAKTPEGKQVIEDARNSGIVTVNQSLEAMVIKNTSLSNLTSVTNNPNLSPNTEATPTQPSTNAVTPKDTSESISPSHRAFVPPTDNRENTQETASLFWLMIPLSLGGLILWRSYKRRSRQDRDLRAIPMVSPNSLQKQPSLQKAVYPPLPDVWDELATDEQEESTQGTTSSTPVEWQESEAVTAENVQPSTEVVRDGDVRVSDSTKVVDDEDIRVSERTKTEPASPNEDLLEDDKALDLDWEAPVAVVTPLYPKFSEIAAMVSNSADESVISDQ
ncbi:substrate-binding domain-containing protein [Scytonema sp. NUACC26]|uniref:substrate-binding domain-containing protein n=1 Tax=Scytonema sp. NUACC26 TaxID=3140176 RepID=UPI0038B2780E